MIVSATEIRLVLTTAGSREEADRLAGALVEEHLAACVNVIPGVRSVYRWQAEVEASEELLLLIKTTSERLERVEAEIRRIHSYELPEFLVLRPDSGSRGYIEWLTRAAARPG
jgi:periplasmic divalent cation tolerance protein